MANITKIFNNSVTTGMVKHVFDTPNHRTVVRGFAPHHHVRVGAFIQVDRLPRKKDYEGTIRVLRGMGIAMNTIAEVCGISPSYAYKLNRRK